MPDSSRFVQYAATVTAQTCSTVPDRHGIEILNG
jgi:hypothetical protein